MISCFGVVNCLPRQIVTLVPRNIKVTTNAKDDADLLIVLSTDRFKQMRCDLRQRKIRVAVLDSATMLRHWNMPIVQPTKMGLAQALKLDNTVAYAPYDPIRKMLNESTDSFVSNLLTLVHKVRDPQRQQEIRDQVFSAIFENRIDLFVKRISGAPELVKLLQSQPARNLVKGMQEIKSGKSLSVAATSNQLSKFDIQYVIKYIERLTNQ